MDKKEEVILKGKRIMKLKKKLFKEESIINLSSSIFATASEKVEKEQINIYESSDFTSTV